MYICSPTLYQSAYVHLQEYYGNREKLIKCHTGLSVKIGHFFDNDEEIISPEFLDKNKNHIITVDDMKLEDQTKIKCHTGLSLQRVLL